MVLIWAADFLSYKQRLYVEYGDELYVAEKKPPNPKIFDVMRG
jgi:hypothetical protein